MAKLTPKMPDDLGEALFDLVTQNEHHRKNIEMVVGLLVIAAEAGERRLVVYCSETFSRDDAGVVASYLKRRRGLDRANTDTAGLNPDKTQKWATPHCIRSVVSYIAVLDKSLKKLRKNQGIKIKVTILN